MPQHLVVKGTQEPTLPSHWCRLEQRRRQLAPEVAKWRKYEAAQQQHAEQQVLVLGQQVGLLKRQTEGLQRQARAMQHKKV